MRRATAGLLVGLVLGLLAWTPAQGAGAPPPAQERAYELNREGMIAMSEARFEDAIEAFEGAAALAEDYAISGQPLTYTPVFMTAWAAEKIGKISKACPAYRRYLAVATEHPVEPTKVEHAKAYVSAHCAAQGQP